MTGRGPQPVLHGGEQIQQVTQSGPDALLKLGMLAQLDGKKAEAKALRAG